MKVYLRRSIGIGMFLAACSGSAMAAAQTTGAPAGAGSAPDQKADSTQSNTNGVQDIVVTAQRRSENSQRASISLAVLSAATLETRGVTDSQTLNGLVPGLRIAYTGGQVQTFIRGVGDVSANSYTQASVALNVDGVYLARTVSFGPIFFDVARVEVLRGPQGTLYGRNASGGAINVITNAPKLGVSEGFASVEIGNYDLTREQAAINVPITDKFAIRVAGQVVDRNGYLTDGSNDDRSKIGRLRALWQPTDAVSVNFTLDGGHQGGKGFGRVYRPALFGNPWTGPQDSRITTALYPNLITRDDNFVDNNFYSLTGQLNWNFSRALNLTVIPAYRFVDANANAGADFIFAEHDISKQKSLEARLGGDAGPFKYVVGAYAFKEDLSISAVIDARSQATHTGSYSTQIFPAFDTTAYAGFGEATLSLTHRFRVIGGLRDTRETRSSFGDGASYPYVNGVQVGTIARNHVDISTTINKVTYRAGAEYDLAPRSMVYANVSTGFKSGGFSASIADPFRPEYVKAYQVGSKNRFFDNKLQLNLEGFYWKYRDQQIAFLGVDLNGNSAFITRNAGQSTIYGVSGDAIWQPTPQDTLNVAAEYLHTHYDSFVYTTLGASLPIGTERPDGCFSGGASPTQPGLTIVDCSGRKLQRSPNFSGDARYTHSFELKNGAKITLGGTIKFSSTTVLGQNYLSPQFQQGAYQTYDADVQIVSPDSRWSLQFYGRNLANTAYYMSASNESSIPPTSGPNRGAVSSIGNPRTYGAVLKFKY